MTDKIKISPKHGVNPSVTVCWLCLKDTAVALFGALKDDVEAPRRVIDPNPCPDCRELMKQGIILISVDLEKTGADIHNPYRTGGWVVVRQQFIERLFEDDPDQLAHVLKMRAAFVPDAVWDAVELPRGEMKAE